MKRSQINNAIKTAMKRLDNFKITLPMFGYWTEEEWKEKKDATGLIRKRMLGWDVTDFGSNDFEHCGAVLFTVRNGDKDDKDMKIPYAEKYMILSDDTEQEIPLHYHIYKCEDIINCGGGVLCIQLFNKALDGGLDTENDVEVYTDSIKNIIKAGEIIELKPGNSITIEPYVYHRFYAKRNYGMLIAGEVSKVNDDNTDNIFYKPSKRFTSIIEDEPIFYPLVNEYNY